MTTITHIRIQYTSPCEATVKAPKTITRTWEHRAYNAKHTGLPVDQCGLRAAYKINGACLCQNHAGQAAIKILMEPGHG